MKLFAPEYYKRFKCIADKCKHSCCVGWEIDIDPETLDKYKTIQHPYSTAIKNSINFAETPHFKLLLGDRCPHLSEKGLCNIILNIGEDYLCGICREHPRFYNFAPQRKEVGIGLSCEEAARIILSADDYKEFFCVNECVGEVINASFDPLEHRKIIYNVLSDSSLTYDQKLNWIYKNYCISPSERSDAHWKNVIDSLEYLDSKHKELFECYSSDINHTGNEKYLERALAYFIFRYCTEANDEDEFSVLLGFCLFCERLFASLLKKYKNTNFEDICELARIISEEIEYSEENTEKIIAEF